MKAERKLQPEIIELQRGDNGYQSLLSLIKHILVDDKSQCGSGEPNTSA